MIEYWQAGVFTLGTAGITVFGMLAAQRLQQAHDAKMDRGEAARALRRERIQPIVEFLDISKAIVGDQALAASHAGMYAANVLNVKDHMTADVFRRKMDEASSGGRVEITEWFRRSDVALSTATDLDVRRALLKVRGRMAGIATDPEERRQARKALRAAEAIVDQYFLDGGQED